MWCTADTSHSPTAALASNNGNLPSICMLGSAKNKARCSSGRTPSYLFREDQGICADPWLLGGSTSQGRQPRELRAATLSAKEIRRVAQGISNPSTSQPHSLAHGCHFEESLLQNQHRLSCSLAGMQGLRCRGKAARREPQALWRRSQLCSLSRDHHMEEFRPETTPALECWPRKWFEKTQNVPAA